MDGITEAREWLHANAPEWVMVRAEARLLPGPKISSPTIQEVVVDLSPKEAVEMRFFGTNSLSLRGIGPTHLEAVKAAVGALR